MKLEPKHNWIQVTIPVEEESKEKSFVVLPEDYKPAEKQYKSVVVVTDPNEDYMAGDRVLVPTHMIRDIEVDGFKFHLVERNHIMAVLR